MSGNAALEGDDAGPDWSPAAINDAARALMVRYSDSVTVRCQPETTAAIARAAKAKGTRPAEYVRQALLAVLRLDGFDPADIPARDAGALYDSQNGKRCYALVSAGHVLSVVNYADQPELGDANHHPAGYVPVEGDAWLPIVHLDSEPYDPALHWRLPHIEHVQADRVVREFPVVPKSWETA